MSNKLLIVSLALVMVCSLNTHIFADGIMPSGAGTEADPFQVATLDNLLWFQTNDFSWSKCFIQTADIDAGNTGSPIGDATTHFTGTYDGQEYTISNFSSSGGTLQGLFGWTDGATIVNVCLVDCSITGNGWVGGLIGGQYGGTLVSGCYVTGSVTGSNHVGGLIGIQIESTVTKCHTTATVTGNASVGGLVGTQDAGAITDCYAEGSVIGSGDLRANIGGLVGSQWGNDPTIDNCYATGSISGWSETGGLIGCQSSGTATDCYSSGSVSGYEFAGGLIGASSSSTTKCYSKGSVSGTQYVGGLIGGAGSAIITDCYARGTVSGSSSVGGLIGEQQYGSTDNCYSTGLVSGSSVVGGLIGRKYQCTVTSSYWDTQTSGQSTSSGGTGKTTTQMKEQSTYVGWDFTTTWMIRSYYNNGYPEIKVLVSVDPGGSSVKEMSVSNYPNPVQNRTTISYSIKGMGNNETVDVRVFNLKGQLIECAEATGGSLELNTKHYAPGIYLYKVAHEKKTLTGKMMIVK